MNWRLLPYCRYSAALNMGIDEAVAEMIREEKSPPTVRLYGWEPSAVSIGCFQSITDEVNVEECGQKGVDIVRRRTGGGAVFHDQDGEITYSVIAPEWTMGSDIGASYREVCGWAIEALDMLGLKAHFVPINDILIGERKVSGCAQTRREGVFLQHGTILYSVDPMKMFSFLRIDEEKVRDKNLSSVKDRVIGISTFKKIKMTELLYALQCSFCRCKEWYEAPLNDRELSLAEDLARSRYKDYRWTYSR